MRGNDTKKKILDEALRLFSERGYDTVGMDEIAAAVGVRAPSLYNHFSGKQAIFDALVESVAARYEKDTGKIDIHVQNVGRDVPTFAAVTEDGLAEKVRQLFLYSLQDETVSRFRRMMTKEQFRSPAIAALYSERYVDRLVRYHADMFRAFSAARVFGADAADAEALARMYVSPVIVLIGICDRTPEREAECLRELDAHVRLFFRLVHGMSSDVRKEGIQ